VIKDRAAFVERAERLIACADIIKISEAAMEYLYPGLHFETRIEKILSTGHADSRLLVCTLGKNGAGSMIRARAPVVYLPVLDTIGAGDTFHGSFLAFLDKTGRLSRSTIATMTEQDLNAALVFANKATPLVCSREGTYPPTLTELEQD
jgi:fructokinase